MLNIKLNKVLIVYVWLKWVIINVKIFVYVNVEFVEFIFNFI